MTDKIRVIEIGASDENADWIKKLPKRGPPEPPEGFKEYWEETLKMVERTHKRLIRSLKGGSFAETPKGNKNEPPNKE